MTRRDKYTWASSQHPFANRLSDERNAQRERLRDLMKQKTKKKMSGFKETLQRLKTNSYSIETSNTYIEGGSKRFQTQNQTKQHTKKEKNKNKSAGPHQWPQQLRSDGRHGCACVCHSRPPQQRAQPHHAAPRRSARRGTSDVQQTDRRRYFGCELCAEIPFLQMQPPVCACC